MGCQGAAGLTLEFCACLSGVGDGTSWMESAGHPPPHLRPAPSVRLRAEIAEAVSSLGVQLPLAGAGVEMGTLGGVWELEGKQLAKPE